MDARDGKNIPTTIPHAVATWGDIKVTSLCQLDASASTADLLDCAFVQTCVLCDTTTMHTEDCSLYMLLTLKANRVRSYQRNINPAMSSAIVALVAESDVSGKPQTDSRPPKYSKYILLSWQSYIATKI
jgi:hypothetical protein